MTPEAEEVTSEMHIDPHEECGRWNNGRLESHCDKAGTEFCCFDCPYGWSDL